MTLTIPCGRLFPARDDERIVVACKDGDLCPYCGTILILKAACLGVANNLQAQINSGEDQPYLEHAIGRLRADVARVDGRTE